MTRRGTRIKVYQLQSGCSNHYTTAPVDQWCQILIHVILLLFSELRKAVTEAALSRLLSLQLYRKHQTYLQGLVGDEFEELPSNLFRLLTYGEILSAESFEYDDLHVEYFLDLPSSWKSDPGEVVSFDTITRAFSHGSILDLFLREGFLAVKDFRKLVAKHQKRCYV